MSILVKGVLGAVVLGSLALAKEPAQPVAKKEVGCELRTGMRKLREEHIA